MKLMGMDEPPGGKKRRLGKIVKNAVPYSGTTQDGKQYQYQAGNVYAVSLDDIKAIQGEYPTDDDLPKQKVFINGKARSAFVDPDTKDMYIRDDDAVGGVSAQQAAADAERAKDQRRIEAARASRSSVQSQAPTPAQQQVDAIRAAEAASRKPSGGGGPSVQERASRERARSESVQSDPLKRLEGDEAALSRAARNGDEDAAEQLEQVREKIRALKGGKQ